MACSGCGKNTDSSPIVVKSISVKNIPIKNIKIVDAKPRGSS